MKRKGGANLSLGSLNFDFFLVFFHGNYGIKVWKFNLSYFVFILNTRSRDHGNKFFFFEELF